MKKYCDLHTHSVFSDGTWTPSQIIEKAGSLGLSSVALCDHNTVNGLPDFIKAAEGRDIEAVCGCEFSVDYEGRELHLLGLFIRPVCFSDVSALMDSVIAKKEQSNIDLVSKLNNAGFVAKAPANLVAAEKEKLEKNKEMLATLDARIAELTNQLSQSNQNAVLGARIDAAVAEILRRTGNDCPTAAYIVQPPTPVNFPTNGCGTVQFGGCGCGF